MDKRTGTERWSTVRIARPAIVATSSGFGGGQGTTTSTELDDLVNATSTRWSAAVVGDQSASTLTLSSSTAMMAIGGWGGSDDSPTLVTDSAGSQISTWVEAHFTATTVGGSTVDDLTSSTS